MNLPLQIIMAVIGNWIIGCIVCTILDDEKGRILQWANECPIPPGTFWVASAWPAVLVAWFWQKRGNFIR